MSRLGVEEEADEARTRDSLRLRSARALMRLAFRAIRPRRLYEPVRLAGRTYPSKRDSDVRWRGIAGEIASRGAETVLDIGCAEGWFLRRAAAEFGCFGLGIEAGDRRVLLGEIARLHDAIERVAVMKAMLTPDDIRRLPRFDIVLCLSVAHHVILKGGVHAAEDFVRAVAGRATKALVFELGTSEERAVGWAAALPDMPSGQEAWVAAFLASCGLRNIRVIASTPGLKKDAPRLLFAAEPDLGS